MNKENKNIRAAATAQPVDDIEAEPIVSDTIPDMPTVADTPHPIYCSKNK